MVGLCDKYGVIVWIPILLGTAAIGVEKLINQVHASVETRFCAMLVAGALGLLIQIIIMDSGIWCLLRHVDNGYKVFTWIKIVMSCFIGLLYAIGVVTEMVENQS